MKNMHLKSIIGSVLTLVVLAFTVMSFTNFRGWQKLGEKKVDYRMDHDVMNVTLRDGTFKQLRFAVKQGSLNMYKCVVHFENGGSQEIDLRHTFTRRSASRVVDLNGNKRFIEKISFWYDTKNFSNNKAVLHVYGK